MSSSHYLTTKLPDSDTSRLRSLSLVQDLWPHLQKAGKPENIWVTVTLQRLSALCHAHLSYLALCQTEAAEQEHKAFNKFNCTPMSANLRLADAIWKPDSPVRGVEEKDLPKRKQTYSVPSEFWWRQPVCLMIYLLSPCRDIIDYKLWWWPTFKEIMAGACKSCRVKSANMKRDTGAVGVCAADYNGRQEFPAAESQAVISLSHVHLSRQLCGGIQLMCWGWGQLWNNRFSLEFLSSQVQENRFLLSARVLSYSLQTDKVKSFQQCTFNFLRNKCIYGSLCTPMSKVMNIHGLGLSLKFKWLFLWDCKSWESS